MWYLTEVKDASTNGLSTPSPRYWLGGILGKGRTIGRKHVDIRLKASSVSRTHAKISVFKAAFYSPTAVAGRRRHQSTSVSVEDSSAYGTFLKYPPGHTSNRTEIAAGHHRRLDKDTPTEISEGALLAFGAPSAWWRLGWENIVVMGSRLSPEEQARLAHVSQATSLECVETWGHDVTHFVTSQCVCSSMKFLTALVEGKHIVTMAWVEAVMHTIGEACRAITEAANEEAALSACALADEQRFIPSFSPSDQASYGADVLGTVFDPSTKEKRVNLFRDVTFAFTREERRARWSSIIEAMGGKTMLAQAVGGIAQQGRIVVVQSEQALPKRTNEPASVAGRAFIQELALIATILGADLTCLDTAAEPAKPAAAEITDVATPGPLDESDAETDDSDPGDTVTQEGTRQVVTGDANGEGARGDAEQPGGTRKRARVSVERSVPVARTKEASRSREKSIVAESPSAASVARNIIDSDDVNERNFFKVDEIAPVTKKQKLPESSGGKGVAGRDVRLFRRRKLPSASIIPLKKVKHDKVESRGADVSVVKREARRRDYSNKHGAHVVDSEED